MSFLQEQFIPVSVVGSMVQSAMSDLLSQLSNFVQVQSASRVDPAGHFRFQICLQAQQLEMQSLQGKLSNALAIVDNLSASNNYLQGVCGRQEQVINRLHKEVSALRRELTQVEEWQQETDCVLPSEDLSISQACQDVPLTAGAFQVITEEIEVCPDVLNDDSVSEDEMPEDAESVGEPLEETFVQPPDTSSYEGSEDFMDEDDDAESEDYEDRQQLRDIVMRMKQDPDFMDNDHLAMLVQNCLHEDVWEDTG